MNDEQKQIPAKMAFVSMLLSGGAVAVALATLAYVISPVDFVPDFIPVAGQADDAGAITFLLALLYGLQKSGVLTIAMEVWREVEKDFRQAVDKAIEEVSK